MAQPMPPSYMAYDRTIVVFSPDGRLLQVEYARQMVKKGSTCLGLVSNDSVILGTVKPSMPLSVPEGYRKIFEVDNHIALVSAGSLADARSLLDMARMKAQINKLTYGEPISVKTLTKTLSDRKHLVTQYAGVRPYGVGLLVGGVSKKGPQLFETDPSGTMIEWKAQSIGRGSDRVKKFLANNYREGMTIKDAARLVSKALKTAEKNIRSVNVEMVVVSKSGVKKLSREDLTKA